jgi:Ohr subfamily peroxiredoxin
MTEKLLFTGRSHVTGGPNGAARGTDGHLDIKLPAPHPAAEQLFAAAWSACFIGAIELAAARKKIALPATPEMDTTIDLFLADNAFFLRARLDVSVPGIDREIARELIDAAHGICPYSKATRGNIDVELNLV